MELGEIMKSIGEQVKQIRPARLVLDSVTEMRLLARDALRHRRQVFTAPRIPTLPRTKPKRFSKVAPSKRNSSAAVSAIAMSAMPTSAIAQGTARNALFAG
jgi:hypothetical protein